MTEETMGQEPNTTAPSDIEVNRASVEADLGATLTNEPDDSGLCPREESVSASPLESGHSVQEQGERAQDDRVEGVVSDVRPAFIPDVIPTLNLPRVIEFQNVSKTYAKGTPHEYTAIRDINFHIDDLPEVGELIALLGPSGCGKSTVLRLIAGLEPQHPATTGKILSFGKPITGPGSDRGMVFQEYTAFDNRTVLDNIAFGLECRGMKKKERHALAREWISKVGLNPVRDALKYPHQLSGGMRQRVAIARTLILQPRIVLMDEPFGALDPMTRLRMQDLLVDLWLGSEATIFFVTHSIEEAVFLGDRVYLFSPAPGTIVEEIHAPRPEQRAVEAQSQPEFAQRVRYIREKISAMEEMSGIL